MQPLVGGKINCVSVLHQSEIKLKYLNIWLVCLVLKKLQHFGKFKNLLSIAMTHTDIKNKHIKCDTKL
jgi:hypothetical protein